MKIIPNHVTNDSMTNTHTSVKEDGISIWKQKGLIISDFNVENLVAFLNNSHNEPSTEVCTAPFGQVIQTLADEHLTCWQERPEFVIVWARPESALEEYRKVVYGSEPVDLPRIETQVDAYCELLLAASRRTKTLFVTSWAEPGFRQGHGIQDLASGFGISRILMQTNLRLLKNLDGVANIHVLNAQKWMEFAGGKSLNPRLWFLGKIPFGNEVFKFAAGEIKASLRSLAGRSRKLIIFDLDETLWGGIVGDVGWQNLALGGHDPAGEALVAFQQELKILSTRGMILGIVSKNEESVALEAIEKHPEMVLKLRDIAGWRINWDDKAENIVKLTAQLNLGLDAVVFIDDDPVERDRVREALPEVLVPEWPADKRLYVQALLGLDCFAKPVVSEEDRQRSRMYFKERQRTELKTQVGSMEKWLESLRMTLTIEELDATTLPRAVQLLNKTNQMNLSTRRMNEAQLVAWAAESGHRIWLFRVSDKFGDSGLAGIASLECHGFIARVMDFILSCRVMGRRIEEVMLGEMIDWARSNGLKELQAFYQSTAKNKPCLDFLVRSGLKDAGEGLFTWSCEETYPVQPHIHISRLKEIEEK
jgi:FkbH-like protein